MENENKEIFDYDEYVKSGEKNGRPKKNNFRRNKNSGAKNNSAPVNKDKPAEEKKSAPQKQTPAENKPKPAEEKKPAQQKQTSAENKPKPTEEKKSAQQKQTSAENKDKPAKESKKKSEELKNAGKKIHSGGEKKNRQESGKKEERARVKEESIDSIKKMFDGALGGDNEEMAELTAEEPVPEMPVTETVDRSKRYFMLGLLAAFFAVIGIISTVSFSIDRIREFADNTQQKDEFARFIYPVVICDPAPFDEVMKMNNDTVLMSAIWDIILYEDKSRYVQDFDYITVPEVDIEKHAVKLFGEGISIVHKSLLANEVKFYYEEDLRSYRIPSKPRYFTYSPYVEGIERSGDEYTLSVGYISPTPAYFDLTSKNETPTPDKYVEYVVVKHGDEYTITEINISDKGRDPNLGL